jgi:hypothetical protein
MYITELLHELVKGVDFVAEHNRGEMHEAVEDFLGFLREHDPKAPPVPAPPAPEAAAAEPIPVQSRDERIAALKAELAALGE